MKLARSQSLLLVLACLFDLDPVSVNGDNVDNLKAFLTNFPPVEIAVIRNKNDLNKSDVTWPYVIDQGAREDGNFYMRQVLRDANENDPFNTNTIFAAGRSGLVSWRAGQVGSKNSIFYIERTYSSKDVMEVFPHEKSTNQIIQGVAVNDIILSRFLDFGLIDVAPHSFQFEGNKFKVHLRRGSDAEGELELEDNRVSAIRFQILGERVFFVSKFAYTQTPLFQSISRRV